LASVLLPLPEAPDQCHCFAGIDRERDRIERGCPRDRRRKSYVIEPNFASRASNQSLPGSRSLHLVDQLEHAFGGGQTGCSGSLTPVIALAAPSTSTLR